MRISLARRALPAVALLVWAAGCEALGQFSGTWQGPVSPDPAQQQGFGHDAVLRATVGAVTRSQIELSVQLPGTATAAAFAPIRYAAGDALGEMRIDGDPLRSYLGYVQPTGESPYLTVVSLFADNRIDLRLIRGPEEVYGVFSLRRSGPRP